MPLKKNTTFEGEVNQMTGLRLYFMEHKTGDGEQDLTKCCSTATKVSASMMDMSLLLTWGGPRRNKSNNPKGGVHSSS